MSVSVPVPGTEHKMQTLSFLHDYFSALRFRGFEDFNQLFGAAYPPSTAIPLEDRLEFSLLVSDTAPFDLRFGLFKIYDPDTLLTIFRQAGHNTGRLEDAFAIMAPLVQEYGLGVDWNAANPRMKAYFLRLQDAPNAASELCARLPEVSRILGTERLQFPSDLSSCSLLCIDHFSDARKNLKVYLRSLSPDREEIAKRTSSYGLGQSGFDALVHTFAEDDLLDVTYSYKYSAATDVPVGFSSFFHLADDCEEGVLNLVRAVTPRRSREFQTVIDALRNACKGILFTHVGFTYSFSSSSEQITTYSSPVTEASS